MKRWGLITLFSLFCMMLPLTVHANFISFEATGNAIRVTDETGQLQALLYKGNDYIAVRETANCYYIEIENANGCVAKTQSKLTTTTITPKVLERTNISIYAKSRAMVFDEQGNRIALIEKNRRHYVVDETATHYVIRMAGRAGYVRKELMGKDRGIPVLMYHHLLYETDNALYRSSATITPTAFGRQMRFLADHNIQVVTTADIEQYLLGQRNIPKNAVVITFDDGLKSNAIYAYPILKQYGYRATNFLITGRVKEVAQPFDPNNLQFIAQPELPMYGDIFDYHGHTHYLHYVTDDNVSFMVAKTRDVVKQDLQTSMDFYEQRYFAYPFGQYTTETIEILKEVGYQLAFTTKDGYVNFGDDPYQLARKGVYPKMTLQQFRTIMLYE